MPNPRYTTVAALKARHGLTRSDRDNTDLAEAIMAAEALVDTYCGRSFIKADTTARFFRARGAGHFTIIDDAIDIASVETGTTGQSGTFTAFTSYVGHARLGEPVTRLEADIGCFPTGRGAWVKVTPTTGWGWNEVPDQIVAAVHLHAAKLYKRKDSPEGVTGFAELGILNVKTGLDVDAQTLLKDLRRLESWAP